MKGLELIKLLDSIPGDTVVVNISSNGIARSMGEDYYLTDPVLVLKYESITDGKLTAAKLVDMIKEVYKERLNPGTTAPCSPNDNSEIFVSLSSYPNKTREIAGVCLAYTKSGKVVATLLLEDGDVRTRGRIK